MNPTMSQPQTRTPTPFHPTPPRPETTLVSLVAARAGREVISVLIAGAFLLVEAIVFLTDLPTARCFHRRESAKTTGASQP